jgi:ribosomal protein S2
MDIKTSTLSRYFQNQHNTKKSSNEPLITTIQKAKQPALIIIPDIIKSAMIVQESQKVGIPIIGLINSTTLLTVDYPLITNNDSIHLVHFFCFFLSNLIAKHVTNKYHLATGSFNLYTPVITKK